MSSERDLIPPADLVAAIKRVLVDKESQRQVAKDFNIPRTNLQRYLDKVKRSIPDVTVATNDDLLQCLNISTTRGSPSVCLVKTFLFFSILPSSNLSHFPDIF